MNNNKPPQYTLVKLPIKEIIKGEFDFSFTKEEEIQKNYRIAQGDSLLFDQIKRIRGKEESHITEIILVDAKKNPRTESALKEILTNGFTYNGIHYKRFGRSASQGKVGITGFICDEMYDELWKASLMDIEVDECVISKFEAQRCLIFSSCTLIYDYIPNIVIIDEYEKILPKQKIKYVVEREKEYTDKNTGETKKYKSREIEEGNYDMKISPFDGCGCHELEFSTMCGAQLGLDYNPIGLQVRMPYVKGYSVYVPFKKILRDWGYTTITDIYGIEHNIDDIDCIWNTSMFKAHKLFKGKYGKQAWNEYMNTFRKYEYKLGISKYSHHINHLNKYTRMNFQYLQCLDLWNPKYVKAFEDKMIDDYDILDENNDGKIIKLAKYTTDLFEKIILGEKFYTYKFMGINDSNLYEPKNKYLEACLINDVMLKDPAVKNFLYRKLNKFINECKVGKIYCSGFYHTGVGDMIGYLQYAVGEEPIGCLKADELYSGNFPNTPIVVFRSPLVDSSEVNKTKIVHNEITDNIFGYFKDQDVVMFNMYDIALPQAGGADLDGDIFYLSNEPIIINSKIDKSIVIDIEDKATAKVKPYTVENITEYELMTRDSRIGEITNCATSIENKYATNPEVIQMFEDYSSLLRIFQGKEIDYLKTGIRWHMNKSLRKYLKQLPYFLLHNYPTKLKHYNDVMYRNKNKIEAEKETINCYHSPSPMNELCKYIMKWEKKNIVWNNKYNLMDTRCLILNSNYELKDRAIISLCKDAIERYQKAVKIFFGMREKDEIQGNSLELVLESIKSELFKSTGLESEEELANYVIKASYSSKSFSKTFVWSGYGDYIISNLKQNSNPNKRTIIEEVDAETPNSYEFLGKWYVMRVADSEKNKNVGKDWDDNEYIVEDFDGE